MDVLQAIIVLWAQGSGWAAAICVVGFVGLVVGLAMVGKVILSVACKWETSEQKRVKELNVVTYRRQYNQDGHWVKPNKVEQPPFWRYK